MRIIGSMNGRVTVQMSETELSCLTGRDCSNGDMRDDGCRMLPYHYWGEIGIREGWERLALLKANRQELDKAVRQLRAIADVLEPMELVVSPDVPIEELKP